MSIDPVIRSTAAPQSANPYSYTENNPVNGVDPTGGCVSFTEGINGDLDPGEIDIDFGDLDIGGLDAFSGDGLSSGGGSGGFSGFGPSVGLGSLGTAGSSLSNSLSGLSSALNGSSINTSEGNAGNGSPNSQEFDFAVDAVINNESLSDRKLTSLTNAELQELGDLRQSLGELINPSEAADRQLEFETGKQLLRTAGALLGATTVAETFGATSTSAVDTLLSAASQAVIGGTGPLSKLGLKLAGEGRNIVMGIVGRRFTTR